MNVNPGQKIILSNDAFIISESPWMVKGEKKDPIEIRGTLDNFGGGLLIHSINEKSIFENVNFSFFKWNEKKSRIFH